MELVEVPAPACGRRQVLVRTLASAVSAGTERHMLRLGQQPMLRTAMERPDLAARVISKWRREGLAATLRAVRERTEATVALGYSSCGRILEVGAEVQDLRPGELVACAGQDYASHAEVAAVPRTLAARVPSGVPPEHAAFANLGAIALEGVRLAKVELGETAVVIGLGLIGQITVQLLLAAGCRVVAIDLDPRRVELARQAGAAALTNDRVPAHDPAAVTGAPGGADAVLITADSSSNDPVELAARLAREKGRVVAVGLVRMELPRHEFFVKELEFAVSRSAGPGRYDPGFEVEGRDYPYAYVRWTQTRNLEAFLDLLSRKRVALDPLITHRFPFAEAPAAYELLLSGQPHLGIVFHYPDAGTPAKGPAEAGAKRAGTAGVVSVGVIGAGAFARRILLPTLAEQRGVRRAALASAHGIRARAAAEKFGFERTGSAEELLEGDGLDAVFIATPHSTHAPLAVRALRSGRHVFVEKPLCVRPEELDEILAAHEGAGKILMAGFNRRFSPFAREARERLGERAGPATFLYRVNAGPLPDGHWLSRPEEGGRITGEVCHFIDLICYLADSDPLTVFASGSPEGDVQVQIAFRDGSSGVVHYVTTNRARLAKERLEIFAPEMAIEMDDFLAASFDIRGRRTRRAWRRQDKGHGAAIGAFVEAVRRGGPAPIGIESLAQTTRATFAAVRSLRTGRSCAFSG